MFNQKQLDRIEKKLDLLIKMTSIVWGKENTIMATLDDIIADVTAESGAIDSVGVLITGLKQQIADALSGTTLPAPVQAKIDAIFTQTEANKEKLATAINTNP